MAADSLPDYDPLQRAFHLAFEPELARLIADLDLPSGTRLLDSPCGDGFYTQHLARRLPALVTAVDRSPKYLAEARGRCERQNLGVTFSEGDAYALPLADGSADAVWCAMSFISLSNRPRAVAEMRRVLAPGGNIHVVETDEYHNVLLPWPVDVEVALIRALRDAAEADTGKASGRSPSRKVQGLLLDAGFTGATKTTYAADRLAPFETESAEFLRLHLQYLRETARPFLAEEAQKAFDRCIDPDDEHSLSRRDDASLTVLFSRFSAVRP